MSWSEWWDAEVGSGLSRIRLRPAFRSAPHLLPPTSSAVPVAPSSTESSECLLHRLDSSTRRNSCHVNPWLTVHSLPRSLSLTQKIPYSALARSHQTPAALPIPGPIASSPTPISFVFHSSVPFSILLAFYSFLVFALQLPLRTCPATNEPLTAASSLYSSFISRSQTVHFTKVSTCGAELNVPIH